MEKKIRVVIAEDHRIVREGIRLILAASPDIEVVGEAANGREAVVLARELQPDVVVMDITMPDMDGLEATRLIRDHLPQVEVVGLTVHESDEYFFQMLKAGASGYVLKGAASGDLLTAVAAASRGETFLYPLVAKKLVADYLSRVRAGEEQDSYGGLTPREREVVVLIAEGLTNKEIAERLGISPSTVQTHAGRVMEKLKLQKRGEIIKYALRRGLIDMDE